MVAVAMRAPVAVAAAECRDIAALRARRYASRDRQVLLDERTDRLRAVFLFARELQACGAPTCGRISIGTRGRCASWAIADVQVARFPYTHPAARCLPRRGVLLRQSAARGGDKSRARPGEDSLCA